MQRLFLLALFAAILSAYGLVVGPSLEARAEVRLAMAPQPEKQPEKKCITIGDKRICLEDFKKKKDKDNDDGGDEADQPAPVPTPQPEPKAGECQLCDNQGNCSPAGSEAECAQRKATAEQMTVTPFLKWSCKCGTGGGGSGTGQSGGSANPAPEDASSPDPTNADYAKCKIPEQKSFIGKGCLKGHDSSALPESKEPEYVATCKGKSGIPLCGPVPSRGGQFECWCYF